jgi:phosphoadenosine phosphosulfate reductase
MTTSPQSNLDSVADADRAWVENQRGTPLQSAPATLELASHHFGDTAIIASSFGPEDVAILHIAQQHAVPLSVFTIDTGRLPAETYELMEQVRLRLGVVTKVYSPRHDAVERLVSDNGYFSFRRNIDDRKACCHIRKVEPLGRALAGKRAWITGLRREQSVTRDQLSVIDWDGTNNLVKISPLATWTRADVWHYIEEHKLPYNRLHDQGYASIGCAPCSRAVRPHEDERAGRWWWEASEQRECGLHWSTR